MGFLVPRSKLTEYLLNPRHPEGGSKARFFLSRGFPVDAPEVLELALLLHAQAAQEVQRRPGLYGDGEVLILRGPLVCPTGPVLLQSVWYRGEGEDTFRLVTAYPWREK
ncbi:DUF6883 domain-containing protein [Thermus caliditerrae]|uniref:DUF6883 domain-containing protein n=1 Tax=Thermus caliditerrae TaxID=1330700 RepID=UPI002DD44052|nr:DUF6883 domain-containing protein [Thermus caliditerrae]